MVRVLIGVLFFSLVLSVSSAQPALNEEQEVPKRWTVPLDFPEERDEVDEDEWMEIQEVVEPEDLGVILFQTTQGFTPLEVQRAVAQDRSPFFSTVEERLLLLPGNQSPVRFRVQEPLEFYLRVFLNDADPRAGFFPLRDPNLFSIIRFERQRGERKFSLVRAGVTFVDRDVGRPLLVRLFGEHSFIMTPAQPLDPGEYALMYRDELYGQAYDLFCFGIDP